MPDTAQEAITDQYQTKRTTDQNALFHALLTKISKATPWNGEWMEVEDWKRLFIAHVYGQKIIPALEGGGFVVLNKLSRRMRKAELSEVIELIYAWAGEKGIEL